VHQQGSLVAPDRLRFDFPHFGKITPEEIRAIEDMVNGKIAEAVAVHTGVDMPIEEARKIPNVKMFFGDKYGDTVRVVTIDGAFSVEFCGGTHVASTADIGLFKIISESSIASGVRRIEAVTGNGLRQYIDEQIRKAAGLDERIERLIEEQQTLEKNVPSTDKGKTRFARPSHGPLTLPAGTIDQKAVDTVERGLHVRQAALDQLNEAAAELKKDLSRSRVADAAGIIDGLITNATTVKGFKVASGQLDVPSMDDLKSIGDTLRNKLGSGVGLLAAVHDGKVSLVCVVTDDLVAAKKLGAGAIVGAVAKLLGGGGGGRPHMATAGGKDVAKLPEALAQIPSIIASLAGA
jgi:alanyl-tRNA synthetase